MTTGETGSSFEERKCAASLSGHVYDGRALVFVYPKAGRLRRCAGCGERFTGRDLFEVGDDHITFFEGDELCRACATGHGVL